MGRAHICDRDNPVIYLFYSDKDDLLSISFFRLLLVSNNEVEKNILHFFVLFAYHCIQIDISSISKTTWVKFLYVKMSFSLLDIPWEGKKTEDCC